MATGPLGHEMITTRLAPNGFWHCRLKLPRVGLVVIGTGRTEFQAQRHAAVFLDANCPELPVEWEGGYHGGELPPAVSNNPNPTDADPYHAALERVDNTPELDAHRETIFYDWDEGDNHLAWVATALVPEIIEWAEQAEQAAQEEAQ